MKYYPTRMFCVIPYFFSKILIWIITNSFKTENSQIRPPAIPSLYIYDNYCRGRPYYQSMQSQLLPIN